MKTKITKVVALFTTLAIIFSCTEDMEYRDTAVSPVNQLYEPISGKSVELVASATAPYSSNGKQRKLKTVAHRSTKSFSTKKGETFLILFTKYCLTTTGRAITRLSVIKH